MKVWHILFAAALAVVSMAIVQADGCDAEDESGTGLYVYNNGTVEDENFTYVISEEDYLVVERFKNTTADPVIPESVVFDMEGTSTGMYVMEIDYSVFYSDGSFTINSLTLPKFMTVIHSSSLSSNNIKEYIVDSENDDFASVDGVLYTNSKSKLVSFPNASGVTEYFVEKETVIIGDRAFENNATVNTIYLPETLISIGANAFSSSAIENICSYNLTTMNWELDTMPESVITIGYCAFIQCKNLKTLALNTDLTTIGDSAFEGSGLTGTVTIPVNVMVLGSAVFTDCTALEALTSNSSSYVSTDDGVLLYKNGENYSLCTYPAGKTDESYSIPASVSDIEPWAFSGATHLKSVILPDSIINLGESAFEDCTSLESVTFTDKLRIIDYHAFSNCTSLKNVILPSKLLEVGYGSFSDTALETITIPASVVAVGSSAFASCASLKKVVFEEGTGCYVDSYAFLGDRSLERVEILSSAVILKDDSLSAVVSSDESDTYEYTVLVPSGYSIPASAANGQTIIDVEVIGERPYPYENLIGVVFCLIIVFGILYFVREV